MRFPNIAETLSRQGCFDEQLEKDLETAVKEWRMEFEAEASL
jgi:hypothetical protein